MVPFKAGERGRDLEQLQRHRLIGPEDCPGGDPKQQGITDLASGSRNGDANWRAHAGNSVEEDSSSRHLILVERAVDVNHLGEEISRQATAEILSILPSSSHSGNAFCHDAGNTRTGVLLAGDFAGTLTWAVLLTTISAAPGSLIVTVT